MLRICNTVMLSKPNDHVAGADTLPGFQASVLQFNISVAQSYKAVSLFAFNGSATC